MEFILEHNEQLHFYKVYCSEGHYITSFNDGDDILTFSASRLIYCPDTIDVEATYHCITDEQYNEFVALKAQAEEEAEVEAIYEAYPEQPDRFMEYLVQKFGEDTEKIEYYFEKYYPKEPEEIKEEEIAEEE